MKKSGKEKGSDIPDWAAGTKPVSGERPSAYAKRILDEKYGAGNWKDGPGSEYNKLKNMENVASNGNYQKNFWIIGWKLNLKGHNPDLYMIFIPGEKDIPLIIEGKIILFTHSDLEKILSVRKLFAIDSTGFADLVCDVDGAIRMIKRRKNDNKSVILNVLNFLIDSSNGLNMKILNHNKNIIHEFADYLTFNKNLELFFRYKYDRPKVMDSFYSLFGLVFSNSILYQKSEETDSFIFSIINKISDL